MAASENHPKTSPSRDFMVRQATLTALEAAYPHTIRSLGRAYVAGRVARLIQARFTEGFEFTGRVGAEFSRLASRFQVAA